MKGFCLVVQLAHGGLLPTRLQHLVQYTQRFIQWIGQRFFVLPIFFLHCIALNNLFSVNIKKKMIWEACVMVTIQFPVIQSISCNIRPSVCCLSPFSQAEMLPSLPSLPSPARHSKCHHPHHQQWCIIFRVWVNQLPTAISEAQ